MENLLSILGNISENMSFRIYYFIGNTHTQTTEAANVTIQTIVFWPQVMEQIFKF